MPMLLSVRNRGLSKALNIQRNYPIREWPTQWAQIEDQDERSIAAEYLQEMATRQKTALAARQAIADRTKSAG